MGEKLTEEALTRALDTGMWMKGRKIYRALVNSGSMAANDRERFAIYRNRIYALRRESSQGEEHPQLLQQLHDQAHEFTPPQEPFHIGGMLGDNLSGFWTIRYAENRFECAAVGSGNLPEVTILEGESALHEYILNWVSETGGVVVNAEQVLSILRQRMWVVSGNEPDVRLRDAMEEGVTMQSPPMDAALQIESIGKDERFSDEQRAILEARDQRILVSAAAGSGKTSLLVRRIVGRIRGGLDPRHLLALTYTNKAREVMINRLRAALQDDLNSEELNDLENGILTYHKLAARLVRSANPEVSFFDDEGGEEQRAQLLYEARNAADFGIRMLDDEGVETLISMAQNAGFDDTIEEVPEALGQALVFYQHYRSLLRKHHQLDFGETILRAMEAFRLPAVRRQWAGRFREIYCDEYQDTSPAQSLLLQMIGHEAAFFVVGDPAQSIYTWQGADPHSFKHFEAAFPSVKRHALTTNFRCFPSAVREAARFLERCDQVSGEMIPGSDVPDRPVEVKFTSTAAEEAQYLVREIEKETESTTGILARTWSLLITIEKQLLEAGIPYRIETERETNLEWTRQDPLTRTWNPEEALVTLSTIHSQKGEEFDTVFIVGLEQGECPRERSTGHPLLVAWRRCVQAHSRSIWREVLSERDLEKGSQQEEERIFYVAMTRARRRLVLCSARQRGKPSEFLKGISASD